MDRLSPTHRPSRPVAGHQSWRNLLFLHWPVPVDVLRPLVPAALELDLFNGEALVGIVPFAMRDIQPAWLPRVMAFNFLETNVRTYVHHRGRDPAVYFFSLEASSFLAVQAARVGFSLPYFHARMQMETRDGVIHYSTVRRGNPSAFHRVTWRPGEALPPSSPGSLEFFLLERYLLFTMRGGALWRGQVHHTPYPVRSVEVLDVQDGLLPASGLPTVLHPPTYAHASDGVDVEVFALERAT